MLDKADLTSSQFGFDFEKIADIPPEEMEKVVIPHHV
jgi:hypothetical protein